MKSFLAYLRAMVVAFFVIMVPTGALAKNIDIAKCKNDWLAENNLTERDALHLRIGTVVTYNGRSTVLDGKAFRHVWGACAELTSSAVAAAQPALIPAPASTLSQQPKPAAPKAQLAPAASTAKAAEAPAIRQVAPPAGPKPTVPHARPSSVTQPVAHPPSAHSFSWMRRIWRSIMSAASGTWENSMSLFGSAWHFVGRWYVWGTVLGLLALLALFLGRRSIFKRRGGMRRRIITSAPRRKAAERRAGSATLSYDDVVNETTFVDSAKPAEPLMRDANAPEPRPEETRSYPPLPGFSSRADEPDDPDDPVMRFH